jgi:hypothetical protein
VAQRGPKPKELLPLIWTAELAYACGLIATDGCLYSDGRHMNLTSQDLDQLETFKSCLNLTNKIAWKVNGSGQPGSYVQFGNVLLYRWLVSIGITPRKTFTIGKVRVPDQYFFDYLRGEFDGDGHSHAYWDTRWRSSVSLYIGFTSASKVHLEWLQKSIFRLVGSKGNIKRNTRCYNLLFAKTAAYPLYKAMYHSKNIPFLKRKKDKLDRQWAALALARQYKQPPGFVKGGSVLLINDGVRLIKTA